VANSVGDYVVMLFFVSDISGSTIDLKLKLLHVGRAWWEFPIIYLDPYLDPNPI